MAHPVIRRIDVEVVLVGSVLVAVVCGYIFLDHLNELMEAKIVLDEKWLDLDRKGHQAILDQCKAASARLLSCCGNAWGETAHCPTSK